MLVVVKDRISDEIIFSHKPKNMLIPTDLDPPLQPSGIETSVARTGSSCERQVKRKKGKRDKKVNELGLLSRAGRRSNALCVVIRSFNAEMEKKHTMRWIRGPLWRSGSWLTTPKM